MTNTPRTTILTALLAALVLLAPGTARAHCDTLEGPVVAAARDALESGDLTPLRMWLRTEDEAEVEEAFTRARVVRGLSPAAREVADRWFFETVVRLHRAGEGFGFTGLVPAGTPIEPAILAVDRALEDGSPEALVALMTDAVREGLLERYDRAARERAHARESVAAGRRYVAAYVELTHYAERLHALAAGEHAGHDASAPEHPQAGER